MDLANLLKEMSNAKGESIAKVTSDLKLALDKPEAVPTLMHIIKDPNHETKTQEAAAVFLRRKLKFWKSWDNNLQQQVKVEVLSLLDSSKTNCALPLSRSFILLASSIFDMTLTEQTEWTELLQWMEQNCRSESVDCRQIVFNLLTSITDLPDERIVHLIPFILKLIEIGFSDSSCALVRYSALKSAGNMIIHATGNNTEMFLPFVNQTPELIKSLLNKNMDLDTDPFNILVESLTNTTLMATVNLQPSLELAIDIAINDSAYEYLRKCALQYVTEVIKQRSSVIIKLQAMDSLFARIFELMCQLKDPEREADTLLHSCTQVVDILCQRLPSSSFVPVIQKYIDVGTKSTDPFVRRASYLSLAVSMEGCCRFYVEHCLEQLISLILEGVRDSDGSVTLSAMFALGELLSYADTPASDHANLFMPVILECLGKVAYVDFENADENTQLYVSRVFYAVEEACECLDNDLKDYLTDLFSKLTVIHESNSSIRMHELCLESISFAVSAVDKLINPYVQDLLTLLHKYLAEKTDETEGAFAEALGALSSIFRYADDPVIRQHADSTVHFALKVIKEADCEPGLKSSAFDVLASLTCVYKENIDPELLKTISDEVTKTFKSTEGVMYPNSHSCLVDCTNCKDPSLTCIAQRTRSNVKNLANLKGDIGSTDSVNGVENTLSDNEDDDESDIVEDDDSDDDSDIDMIESEFADERISALSLLCDLANNSECKFTPYIDSMLDPVYKHLDFPDENIQSQAIRTLSTLIVTYCNRSRSEGADTQADKTVINEKINPLLTNFYNDLEEKIQEGDVHDIVIAALNGLQSLIGGMDKSFFVVISPEKISKIVEDVFARKIPCLNTACDNELDMEEPELDSRVIEAAGDIIPTSGSALPSDKFKHLFMNSINILMAQLKRPNSTRKAYVIGTIACTINSSNEMILDPDVAFELFNTFLNDDVDEVAQNSSYGMGLLISKMPEKFRNRCDSILNILHSLYQRTINVEKSSLRDNVCGCACRILRVLGYPMQIQILEFIISMIPFHSDRENYTAFFEMANEFANDEGFKTYLSNVIRLGCSLLLDSDDDLLEDTKKECGKLLKSQLEINPKASMEIVLSFNEEQQQALSKYVFTISEPNNRD
ncbi:hypothetical protein GJ496_001360 [Pomphorhynchus laevis]|nr:hypothetical protein GJ496_001360 [Pomphorhynchus laevis]